MGDFELSSADLEPICRCPYCNSEIETGEFHLPQGSVPNTGRPSATATASVNDTGGEATRDTPYSEGGEWRSASDR